MAIFLFKVKNSSLLMCWIKFHALQNKTNYGCEFIWKNKAANKVTMIIFYKVHLEQFSWKEQAYEDTKKVIFYACRY